MNSSNAIDTCPTDATAIWTTVLDGKEITIRPICLDDAQREQEFIDSLSSQSRYHRFLNGMAHPSPVLIKKLVEIDHRKDEAYVAVVNENGKLVQIGVSRYCADASGKSGEFAIVVADAWTHKGLGTLLMQRLIKTAKEREINSMYSIDAAENANMRDFAKHMGFKREINPEDHTQVLHTLIL
jgi:N-acetylglutamate synthase-like GNAT family acetyltransferase